MDQKATLGRLATQLYENARKIMQYCEETNYPSLSFDSIEPGTLLPSDAPDDIFAAQKSINQAATSIQQLVKDPSEFLHGFQIQYQQLACLRWLCHFDIPSRIPLMGTIRYEDVASAASVPVRQLKSIARMAMTANFLREPTQGEIGHSNMSAAWISNPSLNDWATFMTSISAVMASHTVEATEKYGATASKTETTYNVWKNTDRPFFEELKQDEALTKQFASYMKNITSGKGTSMQHLVNGYDWASLGDATIVDLGGSSGHASIALAEAFPQLQFIVQDLPGTIDSSKPDMNTLPSSISDRLTYQHHDFFTPQPLEDVDVFLLRMIIHDWPDAEATEIIKNISGSMKPNGKLIIMDTVLPQPGTVPSLTEAGLRARDLSMMQVHNSKEREWPEWVDLLKAGDERLRINSVVQPIGSSMSVMEVVRADHGPLMNGQTNGIH